MADIDGLANATPTPPNPPPDVSLPSAAPDAITVSDPVTPVANQDQAVASVWAGESGAPTYFNDAGEPSASTQTDPTGA